MVQHTVSSVFPKRYKKHPKPLVGSQDSKLHDACMMVLWAWRIMNHVRYKSINRNTHQPLVTMFARTLVCLAPFRYSLRQMITCRCGLPFGERQGRMLNHTIFESRAPAGTVFTCPSTLHPIFILGPLTMKHSCALHLIGYTRTYA